MIQSSIANTPSLVRIVGAGFTGLACVLMALDNPHITRVEMMDPSVSRDSYNRGASSASAGLMHSLTRKGKEIWKGNDGYIASLNLIDQVELNTMRQIKQKRSKIIRKGGFNNNNNNNNNNDNDNEDCIIEGGLIVDPLEYLYGLWELAEIRAKELNKELIWDTKSLNSYDELLNLSTNINNNNGIIICTMGAGISNKIWGDDLPISYELGRNIIIDNKYNLNDALLNGEYVVPMHNYQKIIFGATHERDNDKKNVNEHYTNLRNKINKKLYPLTDLLWPEIKYNDNNENILPLNCEIRKGIRVQSQRTHLGRIPIVDKHSKIDNCYIATGFGSRGLIHHALVAEMVINAAINNDLSYIPKEMRIK